MIDANVLLKIFPLMAVAIISPGPDFMIISSLSLARGRWAGLSASAGVAIGVGIFTLLSILGFTALLEKFLWMAVTIKILGGLYLLYLGIVLWRSTYRKAEVAAASNVKLTNKNPFTMGLMCSLTNPKTMVFLTSIFALALPAQSTVETKLAILGMITSMVLVWFFFVVVGLSASKVRGRYLRSRNLIDRAAGSLLAFFGIKLLSSVRD